MWGEILPNQSPDFDPRNYGYKKLKALVEATDLFEIDEKMIGDSPAKVVYIKDKEFKTVQFSPTYIRKPLPKGGYEEAGFFLRVILSAALLAAN